MGNHIQPFLLNNVQDISGIEQFILYLAKYDNETKDEVINDILALNATAIEQKITFLRLLGGLRKEHDKLKLSQSLEKYVNSVIDSSKATSSNVLEQKKVQYRRIRLGLLRLLAKQSFELDSNNTYKFKNQAATLLIYSYMSGKLPNNSHLSVNQQTVDDIKIFFNKLGYKPLDKFGKSIQFNENKLKNALAILSYLGLVELIKIKRVNFYFPKVDPYIFYYILHGTIPKDKTPKGISIMNLVKEIGSKYIPLIKKDEPKLSSFISESIGGAIWILFSRNHITLSNKGDIPIVSDKPSFLEAKFTAKVNWIELKRK
ncbi:MAG: hypothetical protein ACTSRZ_21100 [Promethearchaeota archaeon]